MSGRADALRTAAAAALVAAALALFLLEAAEIRPQVDDAYISYRYARNLVDGHGLVFNPGERVEAITNLGYTLCVAAGLALGAGAVETSHALAVASALALLLLAWALARDGIAAERRWLAGFAPLAVLASTPFATWTLSGLETPMFCAFTTAAFLAQARGRPGAAAAAAAGATLTRPEGVLVAAFVLLGPAISTLALLRAPRRLASARATWLAPVGFALFLLALTAFRLAYYGSPVPNTFYAKVGGIPIARGVRYAAEFWAGGAWMLLVPGVFALGSATARREIGFALVLTVYVVAIGGDAFRHGRFLLPALPLLAAAGVRGVDAAWRGSATAGVLLVPLLCAAVLWPPFGPDVLPLLAALAILVASRAPAVRAHVASPAAAVVAAAIALVAGYAPADAPYALGRVLSLSEPPRRADAHHANFLPDEVVARRAQYVRDAGARLVATVAIGRMGFFSGVPILDLLGLADRHIARSDERKAKLGMRVPGHQRSDADYVLSREPDFIFMLERGARKRKTQLPAVLDLWDAPRLERDYEYVDEIGAYRRKAAARVGAADDVLNAPPLFYRPTDEEGRWREFRTHKFDASLSDEQRAMIEQLEAIGYASGSRDAPAGDAPTGVVLYDPARVQPGLNLYTSGHAPEAILMDMEGRELHRWTHAFWDVWPDFPIDRDHPSTEFWRRTQLLPDGSLLAIHEGLGILKLDAESNLVWAVPNRAHHDLAVLSDGDVWVLTREAHVVPRIDPVNPIVEDFVSRLDPDGREIRRFSLLRAFDGTAFAPLVEKIVGRHGDVFHTNSLFVLERDGRDPAFRRGRLLVYMLGVGLVVVVDPETEKVVFARFGRPEWRHDPKITDRGNLLVFENKFREDASRIVEYAGTTQLVEWIYKGTPERPFYSETCGTVDRLPNGNTLVTETDAGHAFELTPEGDVVWEFWNPHRAGPDGRYIASLFEVVRLPEDLPTPWARAPDPSGP